MKDKIDSLDLDGLSDREKLLKQKNWFFFFII